MKEKDLRKLNRYQLLELLIVQTDRADQLEARLKAVEKQLEEKEIQMASLGSIAEASLQLSGVFAAAQEAADLYIRGAKKLVEEKLQAAEKKAEDIIIAAEEEAKRIKNG